MATSRKKVAEETPARPRARKAAVAEETPARPKARKVAATGGRSGKVAGGKAEALEVPETVPEAPVASALETPRAARFLPDTAGPLLPEENLGELPSSYGVDRLVMVPRDPGWMFLYWELSPAMLARTTGRRIVLQLCCRQPGGEAAMPLQDVGHQGRFYAATTESCEAIRAVLGIVTDSGQVEELLGTDWVPVPPARPRPGASRFLTIPFDEPLRVGRRREGARYVSVEGRVLSESEYRRLFGRAEPGSSPR